MQHKSNGRLSAPNPELLRSAVDKLREHFAGSLPLPSAKAGQATAAVLGPKDKVVPFISKEYLG